MANCPKEDAKDLTISQIAHWMVGREVDDEVNHRTFDYEKQPVVLSVENLWVDMPEKLFAMSL